MNLLFTLAHWHGLAKLRQHTDLSLEILESVTNQLGKLLRDFQTRVCSVYATQELKREMTARMRQTPSKARNHPPKFPANKNEAKKVNLKQKSTGRLYKTLNLNTYKDHSLGDYVESIRQNGTIDSYSTELVNIPYYCILLIAYHIA